MNQGTKNNEPDQGQATDVVTDPVATDEQVDTTELPDVETATPDEQGLNSPWALELLTFQFVETMPLQGLMLLLGFDVSVRTRLNSKGYLRHTIAGIPVDVSGNRRTDVHAVTATYDYVETLDDDGVTVYAWREVVSKIGYYELIDLETGEEKFRRRTVEQLIDYLDETVARRAANDTPELLTVVPMAPDGGLTDLGTEDFDESFFEEETKSEDVADDEPIEEPADDTDTEVEALPAASGDEQADTEVEEADTEEAQTEEDDTEQVEADTAEAEQDESTETEQAEAEVEGTQDDYVLI